jgi:hypothetical protein
MKIKNFFSKLILWFKTQFSRINWGEFTITPIRMFSIIMLLFIIFWQYLLPVVFFAGGENGYSVGVLAEILVAVCSFFGLMGNGKTAKFRASIVSIPYLYMATLYGFKLVISNSMASATGVILYGIIGLWLTIFGHKYERDSI